jgi:hypothetical protein
MKVVGSAAKTWAKAMLAYIIAPYEYSLFCILSIVVETE